MKVNKRTYIPVTLTFETEEEFGCFWDAIEACCDLMRTSGAAYYAGSSIVTQHYQCLVDISNLFTEL